MNQYEKILADWYNNTIIADKVQWPKAPPKTLTETYPTIPGGKPIEKDPSGKALNELGAKADAGKNRVYLCLAGFSRALEKVAEITTVGANKYTPNGWKHVPDGYARYMDAFGRHFLAYGQGKKLDNGPGGTGCEHMAQMIWNLLAAYELSLQTLENTKYEAT